MLIMITMTVIVIVCTHLCVCVYDCESYLFTTERASWRKSLLDMGYNQNGIKKRIIHIFHRYFLHAVLCLSMCFMCVCAREKKDMKLSQNFPTPKHWEIIRKDSRIL